MNETAPDFATLYPGYACRRGLLLPIEVWPDIGALEVFLDFNRRHHSARALPGSHLN